MTETQQKTGPMTDTSPPRPVTVPESLWTVFNHIVHDGGLNLIAVTGSPTQQTRYEVRTRKGVVAPGRSDLTDREREVLTGIAAGMSNGEIGEKFHLAENTVKSHARRIFRKLGARDRAHAVFIACQRELISEGRR